MPEVDWLIQGQHFANCNCDYGCPCQFTALPTDGSCRAVVAMRIDKGHWEDISLDGLCAVTTYAWPGPIHMGNGTMQSIIDESATAEQRDALGKILIGEGAEPGSTMLWIYHAMCTTVHDTLSSAIELSIDMDTRNATLVVPGMIETHVESLRNTVTGVEHRARIDLPEGKEFRIAEVASGRTKATGVVPLEFENSHAHLTNTTLSSTGLR